MTRLLDVKALPSNPVHRGVRLNGFLGSLLMDSLDSWGISGLTRRTDSFGLAIAHLNVSQQTWDDPEKFVWGVYGWGPRSQYYAGNAVRKLRPLIREGADNTLDIPQENFRDVVESANPDGSQSWGDFPYGGAVRLVLGNNVVRVGVSGLYQKQDWWVALATAGFLLAKIDEIDADYAE